MAAGVEGEFGDCGGGDVGEGGGVAVEGEPIRSASMVSPVMVAVQVLRALLGWGGGC